MPFSCVTGFLHSKSVIREWQALEKLGGVTVICLKLENLSGKVIAHACSSKQCPGSFNCQSCTTSILVSSVQRDHSPRIIPEVYLGIGWKSSAENHVNYCPVWIERLRQENCTAQNSCASSSILLVTVVLMELVLCRHTCMGDSARNSHYQLVSTVHPHHLQSTIFYFFFNWRSAAKFLKRDFVLWVLDLSALHLYQELFYAGYIETNETFIDFEKDR